MIFLQNFLTVFMDSAPWLMLGLIVAGMMKAFIPEDFLSKHLGAPGPWSTVKAALLGAPLPLCSCGVIPAAMGLRKNGASKSATTSFLISTPETGVDSISISYALLGPFMAVIRPIAAIASAITAGLLVGNDKNESTPADHSSCCEKKTKPIEETHCCSKDHAPKENTFTNKLITGARFTFIDLIDDIAKWLLLGLAMAAAIKTWVPIDLLTQWGDGLLAFIVMAAIGVPMYICATASTPIAAGLLFSGVSPGAVLVFMLVGPATNIATVGLVKTELGNRALAAYLGSVIGVGFLFGFLTNYLAKQWDMNFLEQAEHIHQLVNLPLLYTTSAILGMLILFSLGKTFLFKNNAAHAH